MGCLGSNQFCGREIVSMDKIKNFFFLLCENINIGGGGGPRVTPCSV